MVWQTLAKWTSEVVGRDTTLIKRLRPFYESMLDTWTGGRGYRRMLNGQERFYINPRYRHAFPQVYDPPVMDYLRARVRAGHVSVNVGANVGVYALCLAEWSKPDGRVFAFEPNPSARRLLEDHVKRNRYEGRVTVRSEAIGGALATGRLYAAELSGLSRLDKPNPAAKAEAHRPVSVVVTTVDAFCAEHSVQPDWLVMDIEGHEVAALHGARRTIRGLRGRLGTVVEMHPTLWELSGTSRAEFEALLESLGLRAVGLAGQCDPLGDNGMVALEYA